MRLEGLGFAVYLSEHHLYTEPARTSLALKLHSSFNCSFSVEVP
jgi:hypothetical protein